MQKEDCIFCKIARKEIPSKQVYEDEDVIAFKDINPAAPVHLLIIPKQHYDSLATMGETEIPLLGKMLALAPVLAKEAGATNGFRVVINTGHDSGQEVNHIHVHVLGGARPWKKL
ncbi:MAG: histidine triad nucleotide-binding protein [Burkholderiaceae bacterium]|nr:histidine triad nucleotide-binding protein [Burkholderiaceae bacterium]